MTIQVRDKTGKWLNTQVFKEAGSYFLSQGVYTTHPWGSPAWFDFWEEERRRCVEGYEVGGEKITGNYYFYLNYCVIEKVDQDSVVGKKASKIRSFPDFWDGDYEYFWLREIARKGIAGALGLSIEEQKEIDNLPEKEKEEKLWELYGTLGMRNKPADWKELEGGKDLIIGKARRRGFSYKNASIAANNFFHHPGSYTILMAYEKKYLYPGNKTIFYKVKGYINFINENTGWRMPSDYVNTQSHIRASYRENIDGIDVEKGFMSEIECISMKDNPDAARGADADDIIGEEVCAWGTPGGLKNTIAAMRSSSEAGMYKTGMMTLFGCVCKGTKVWTNRGELTTIENITKETGILGYASKGTIQENISWLQPPGQKECVRITTEKGHVIECSKDHPLLWSNKSYRRGKNKFATFKRAEDIKEGDHLLQALQVPQFGDKQMWNPRLVGLLIGDGYYGSHYASAQLCISEPELFDYIHDIGISYKTYDGKSCDKPFFRYITLHGTQEEMRYLGLQGQSKGDKKLPENIWSYDKDSIAELLGGLFDADGSVQGKGKRRKISLCSVVPELLDGVRTQLFKLGIQSNIFKREHYSSTIKSNVNNKEYEINTKQSYNLEINDLESIRNFKKHIKLLVHKKRDMLNSWDLSPSRNEKKKEYVYDHTIEKGDFFKSNSQMESLFGVRVESVEDIGMQDIYNLTTEHTHTYITNGFISHNTSGDMAKGTVDFADLHSRPGSNGFMAFKDIWGDYPDKVEGFFFPAHLNTEGFYDKNGNSDIELAKELELRTRETLKKAGATSTEIQKRLQEEPLNSAEAFAMISQNSFPVVELQHQLDKVKALNLQELKGTPVDLYEEGGVIKAKPILDKRKEPITSYKDIPINLTGCPVIYEYPVPDAPPGLYKIGYDPIRQDTGTSLAAIVVYKGKHRGTITHDNIVAEYVGRMPKPDDIDRIAEMFADFYNTKIMYENEVTGVKSYFTRIKRLNLLALQPDAVISKNVKKSKVARVYGCHMTTALKDAGERYINIWLREIQDYDENGNPVRTIDRIYSKRLLEELIAYHKEGNFDMISALIMCMFQVEEEDLNKEYESKAVNNKMKELTGMLNKMYQR